MGPSNRLITKQSPMKLQTSHISCNTIISVSYIKCARSKMNRKKVDKMVLSSHESCLRTEPTKNPMLQSTI